MIEHYGKLRLSQMTGRIRRI